MREVGVLLSKTKANLLLITVLVVSCFAPLLSTVKATSYSYTFNGPYDESYGTLVLGFVQVIAHFANNYTTLVCTLNYSIGPILVSYTYTPSSQPQYFEYYTYNMGVGYANNSVRQYWLSSGETTGVYTVFVATVPAEITFTIRALGGVEIGNILRIQRSFNGSLAVVEQRLIDETNSAVANLLPFTVYQISILNGSTGSVFYTFGNVNTISTPIILTVSAMSFPTDVLRQYKYLRLWASRPDSSSIMVSYEDLNAQTEIVSYKILDDAGSIAFNISHVGLNSFVDVWTGADVNMTYRLEASVIQSQFGLTTFNQVLSAPNAPRVLLDLSIFGDFGALDTTQIVCIVIVFAIFLCFSTLNSYIGAFAGVASAAILVILGWLHLPVAVIVTAFGFVFLIGIAWWKRRNN